MSYESGQLNEWSVRDKVNSVWKEYLLTEGSLVSSSTFITIDFESYCLWMTLLSFIHWPEPFVMNKCQQQTRNQTSRFPCCVLSYFSLAFVMEHSRRWQLHIGGGKMFEPLFRAGLSFSGHFFCKIFVFDISNLNFRGHFLVWSAV